MTLIGLKIFLDLMKALQNILMKKVMKDIFFKLLFQYLENLHNLHGDLPFLLERRKIENVEKLIANLHDKTEYIIDIRNLKQAFIVFHQTLFDNSR